MNILLISQCAKRALTQTRRILDQFAERKGDRVWQTPITEAGLNTLRKLLRATARKNTAVACHWIRGANTELLWIVGDARQFNPVGTVPTNTTETDVLRVRDENGWETLTMLRLVAEMAALWHDFGKANQFFTAKLKENSWIKDPYRHEWISLRLFQAFVGQAKDDAQWISQLKCAGDEEWLDRLIKDGLQPSNDGPFAHLPPLARLTAWLIVSHHHLPVNKNPGQAALENVWQYLDDTWTARDDRADSTAASQCWIFPNGLPTCSTKWCARIRSLAELLLKQTAQWPLVSVANPFAAHLARLCLIAADHHFSSLDGDVSLRDPTYKVYANTRDDGSLKQQLDEHLIGVARWSKKLSLQLPLLHDAFPRLIHKAFRKRSGAGPFAWQDSAYQCAVGLSRASRSQGFFGINMASTGTGKTLANARIMAGLNDNLLGARFSVALGLRTLTLQTGDALRQRIGLSSDDLAVMVGSSAVRAIHEATTQLKSSVRGSESAAPLLPDEIAVRYEGALAGGPWGDVLAKDVRALKLLSAPILVCTIDHLMPASETVRGGRHIPPLLRLLTADLVLDEVDDFDLDDLPAVSRLVFFAGMMGTRVLLSSATTPPALAQGLFAAYQAGRRSFNANFGKVGLGIICAWFDEFGTASAQPLDEAAFRGEHDAFVSRRVSKLRQEAPPVRTAQIVEIAVAEKDRKKDKVAKPFAVALMQYARALHELNCEVDAQTSKRVSIGLIRMANIRPIITVAQRFAEQDPGASTRVHLCVYHSRFPLFVRSAKETQLDSLLKRHETHSVLLHPMVRDALTSYPEDDHIFVVLASPVAEVGRDHDYDWAIIEPSSMRSIIQVAGRVRRHRPGAWDKVNIYLLDRNINGLINPNALSFYRPGFECDTLKLASKSLSALLRTEDYTPLTAASRICERRTAPTQCLVDLEHQRLNDLMVEDASHGYNIRRFWTGLDLGFGRSYTAYDVSNKRFRSGREHVDFFLWPRDDADALFRVELSGACTAQRLNALKLTPHARAALWGGGNDLRAQLLALADLAPDEETLARKFGAISLPKDLADKPLYWDPFLGLANASD
jgi:CRISPR-associated endonuclease/helicase Cas3